MMVLHDYWRSGASYRLRIGLELKGVAYSRHPENLLEGAQRNDAFAALNPQKLVPALEVDGLVLFQSGAILEWLEERYPEPPLLPGTPEQRAIIRGMAGLITADVHPFGNLRVLDRLRAQFGSDTAGVKAWVGHWIGEGFAALETLVQRHGDGFAFGAAPTVADCCLIPQLYSAERFDVDLSPYPALVAVAERANALEPFQRAHPSRQSDAKA